MKAYRTVCESATEIRKNWQVCIFSRNFEYVYNYQLKNTFVEQMKQKFIIEASNFNITFDYNNFSLSSFAFLNTS